MNKRGQGLSINTIIVAALALIVLVVLIAIFTGRIAIFEREISQEARTELAQVRVTYGNCQPGNAAESAFLREYSKSEDKDKVLAVYNGAVRECNVETEKNSCEGKSFNLYISGKPYSCVWK